MLALRFAGLVAVAVWFGGLLSLGAIAAPATFDVIAARQIPDARGLAGAVVGEILRRFQLVSYGCGAIILGSLIARAVLGPRPRRFGLRVGLTSALLAMTLYSGVVVTGQIARVREEIGGTFSSVPEHDPRRVTFGRLHAQSTALHLIALIGCLVLLVSELND